MAHSETRSPSFAERLGFAAARRYFSRLKKGAIALELPDGRTLHFQGTAPGRQVVLQVRDWRLFWRVARDGGIGVGESYVAGEWTSPDLPQTISFLLENQEFESERRVNFVKPVRYLHRFAHFLRRNTIGNSRRNIGDHYDLGNEFFSTVLDPTLTYSSALFRAPDDTLETAQRNKLRSIIEKAMITADDHVLEIGSGWGSFAFLAAKETGCRVTTLTLSEQQLAYVRERIAREGLEGRVNVEFVDYRHAQGAYDKIVSIEMMEAVGREYLGDFFAACERLLKPNGLVVLQVITMLDQWYAEYCRRTDWIQKLIFPGSHLPSLTELSKAMTRSSQFIVERLENIAPHYARTLAAWREKLLASKQQLAKLGCDERFIRTFEFYFASCEAQFGTRLLNLVQLVLTRANNEFLLAKDRQAFDGERLRAVAA